MSLNRNVMLRVGADIGGLEKGLKSGARQIKDFGAGAMKAAKLVAGITAAAGAAGAALVGMASASAASAREISSLSSVTGASTKDFQKMAFAAKSVGVEQDKLSDIFKDTQDKVGDFLQTGGGPLADFFENIAPQVGVTAEEFRFLSGPQALQKYQSSLEQANLSQSEMTFFMEAIASDASMLTPLLKDSGEGFARLGERAEQAGAVLSELDIANLEIMAGTLSQVSSAAKTVVDRFSAQLAPVIGALADRFLSVTMESGALQRATDVLFNGMVKGIGFVLDSFRGLQVVVKGIELAFRGMGVVVAVILEAIPRALDIVINSAKATLNSFIDGINLLPLGVDISRMVYGESAVTEALTNVRMAAVRGFTETQNELKTLAMEPMPSGQWSEFVASAQEASNVSAQAIISDRARAIEVTELQVQNSEDRQAQIILDEREKLQAELGKLRARDNAAYKKSQEEQERVRAAIASQRLSATSKAFGDLSSLMNTENKKAFEIGKKAAAAQTIIDTYASAQSAYKSLAGIPIVGPALGAAAAGAAITAGLVRLQKINSTSFGSKSASGGGAGSSGQAPSASSAGGGAGSAGASGGGTSQSLFIEGLSQDSLFSGSQVRQLIDKINEEGSDGKRIVYT